MHFLYKIKDFHLLNVLTNDNTNCNHNDEIIILTLTTYAILDQYNTNNIIEY